MKKIGFGIVAFLVMFATFQTFGDAFLAMFNGHSEGDNIILTWQTGEENGVKEFVVQRKAVNEAFYDLNSLAAKGSNSLYTYVDEDAFFESLDVAFRESVPRPKYVLVNFPHNPTSATVTIEFYERLVAKAKKERFYIISDIAYADLTYDGYVTPSILEVNGAKDVAVESFTLSKSYNMAGWRVGFIVGNARLVGALKKIKSWLDYGMFTPIQVAATVALDGPQECVEDIKQTYIKRRDVLVDSFNKAGWKMKAPNATMFVWAEIPDIAKHLGSMEFSKQLLTRAGIAVSPGVGFGTYGDGYVRIALIENEQRIKQAAKSVKKYLGELKNEAKQ